ncbi:MAG: ankyrin repeat domain-containing protein [Gammaproteobacteria bacterium]|jgi:ankyrin repeat protein
MSTEQDVIDAVNNNDLDRLSDLLAATPGLAAARNTAGISALMLALYQRRLAMINMIRAARDGLDLFEAAALGETATLEVMLEDDPECVDMYAPDGFQPLHLAAFFGRAKAVDCLLAHGADSRAVADNPMRVQPLHCAVAGASLECAELLLDAGANPDARQHGGYTPLMGAAAGGHVEIAELLLDYQADAGLEDDQGRTARDIAQAENQATVVALLEVS